MEDFGILIFLVLIAVIPVAIIVWSNQKKRIGRIRCKRCDYVGPAKGLWVPFRGIKPVCQKCHSEDWVTVKSEEKKEPPPVVSKVKKNSGGPAEWFCTAKGTPSGPYSAEEL